MVLVPRRVRPNQVIQAFVSILRMEYDSEFVNVRISIVKDNVEFAGSSLRFDRPSSRLMQLQVTAVIYVCVCVCVCVHACVHVYMVCMRAHVHMSLCVCMHASMYFAHIPAYSISVYICIHIEVLARRKNVSCV